MSGEKAIWIEDGVPRDANEAITDMGHTIACAVAALTRHGWGPVQTAGAVTGAAAGYVLVALADEEATDAR